MEFLSRRLRALAAAGVIALSCGATGTSVASEADNQDEGVSTQPGAPNDEVGGGTGAETPLPVVVEPVLGDPDPDATTEVPGGAEPPATIPLEVVAPEATGPGTESGTEPGTESPPSPADPPTSTQPPALAPEGDGGGSSHSALIVEDQRGAPTTPRLHADTRDQERQPDGTATVPPTVDVASAPQPAAEPAPAPEGQPAEFPATGGRLHIVQAGESLWSIAADLLNPGASATAIALQVHRLWELNKDRIGTGDPDALPIGVKLRLR